MILPSRQVHDAGELTGAPAASVLIGACQFFCVWGLEVGGDSVGVGVDDVLVDAPGDLEGDEHVALKVTWWLRVFCM